ncbi:MAG: ribonuclease D [Alphaproteobacteria bacterium]|nr:ribonuclease D [Alphaproteobacteria bacterium]
MNIIETTCELENFCKQMAQQPFITVDLEFLREHTYYAKLCLIQIGSLSHCSIIDPLAPDINLQPFFNLMTNPDVIKVFHSGRQDIEIIYNLSHQLPFPIFDTQIAGMATGFGEAISYENLVSHILHIKLDKSNRLSDWSKRPLNPAQLEYALADVTHLVHVYEFLRNKLETLNRTEWIKDEMNFLSNPKNYETAPDEAWLKIKHRSHNAKFLTLLRELAAWREARSQRKNTPRHSFIKDDALLAICAVCPQTKEDLLQIRNLRRDIAEGRLGSEIIEVINHFTQIDPKDYVSLPQPKDWQDKNNSLFELLKMLLKIISQEHGIVSRLLASDDDLRKFCITPNENNTILSGWRYEIFGKQAEALRAGKLAIHYNPVSQDIIFENIDF